MLTRTLTTVRGYYLLFSYPQGPYIYSKECNNVGKNCSANGIKTAVLNVFSKQRKAKGVYISISNMSIPLLHVTIKMEKLNFLALSIEYFQTKPYGFSRMKVNDRS